MGNKENRFSTNGQRNEGDYDCLREIVENYLSKLYLTEIDDRRAEGFRVELNNTLSGKDKELRLCELNKEREEVLHLGLQYLVNKNIGENVPIRNMIRYKLENARYAKFDEGDIINHLEWLNRMYLKGQRPRIDEKTGLMRLDDEGK